MSADPSNALFAAVKAIQATVMGDSRMMAALRAMAGEKAAVLVSWVAHGEAIFRRDPRFKQPKAKRDQSRVRIAAAARTLAAELRATTWPGLALLEVQQPPNRPSKPLPDYLDWLADWAQSQVLDYATRYPRGQSKTSHREFMLRHIRSAVYEHARTWERPVTPATLDALARDIAILVLGDEDITEEHIHKL